MKRICSVVLIAMVLFSVCGLPHHSHSAAMSASSDGIDPMEIYKEGSYGEMVVRIQLRLRELGYFNFKPTGAYRGMTVESAKLFQTRYRDEGENIFVDGRIGEQSINRLFSTKALRASIPDSVRMPKGPTEPNLAIKGERVSWESIKEMLVAGTIYRLTDHYTGVTFSMYFVDGVNHAEMEPASQEDTLAFLSVCGDEYNFLKRPVVIEIDGRKIAASFQCYPHGFDTVSNNDMNGHICLFFEGSLSHVGALPDVEHNQNVLLASGG